MKPKLFVQICALNEADTIAQVIRAIPRSIEGVRDVTVVVLDDGSQDDTSQVSRQAGADIVARHTRNQGLGRAFQRAVDICLSHGADLIVHLDADGQYNPDEIERLIAPILNGQADLVVGDRRASALPHFGRVKRWMQWLGSWTVRRASGLEVPDAVSGFRAYSREAALRLFVTSRFSYTVATLIQAGRLGLAVTSVPITARPTPRPSRLQRNAAHFVLQQASILIRSYVTYEPLKTFLALSLPFLVVGSALLVRLMLRFAGQGWQLPGNVQSLVVGSVALAIGLLLVVTGLITDRIAEERKVQEETLYRLRKSELRRESAPSDQAASE